ncbi:hypothetical protein GTP55_07340 [Duganella sp. FT109W]|uniref:Uncharacterized protein n=1 Tax=Duganella margarita TaxID=2692170 RepID=A0ABW9WFH4_9BURK|nr:hypothetical protein [Duganella margarita]MYN39182.1 hypothetical protein [Duganella margarita]
MYTLILTGLMLYVYGFARTLAIYVGIILTIFTLVLEMVCGGGFTYLFWPEWMRTFEIGEFWSSAFTERPSFQLWEAGAVPVIFAADLFRVALRLVTTRCTIFTLGFFAFWLYCMCLMWSIIFALAKRMGK